MLNVVNEKTISVVPLPLKRAFDRSPIVSKKWTFHSGSRPPLKCDSLSVHQGDKEPRFKEGFAPVDGHTVRSLEICGIHVRFVRGIFDVEVYPSRLRCRRKQAHADDEQDSCPKHDSNLNSVHNTSTLFMYFQWRRPSMPGRNMTDRKST